MNRLSRIGRNGSRMGFHLALGFLLWSVMPHFSLYLHSHDGDGTGHTHALLSRSQLEQAQTLAISASEAFGEDAVAPTYGLSGDGAGASGGKADGDEPAMAASRPSMHGHFQEDANATCALWQQREVLIHSAPAAAPAANPLPSAGRLFHSVPARGPPSSAACPAAFAVA